MKPRFWLLLLLPLATFPAGAQEPRYFQNSSAWDNPELSPADDAPILDQEGGVGLHNLTYFYTARLNDRMAFTCILFHWVYGPFGGWRLFVLASEPDGTSHLYQHSIHENYLKAAADRFLVRFPEGIFEANERGQRIRLALPGFSCHLQMRGLLPSWKPGDGLAVFTPSGDTFVRLAVPLPWAEVEGEMSIEGRRYPVRGQLYADQSLAVLPMSRQHSPVYSFRGFSPDDAPEGERWMISIYRATTHPAYGSRPLPILLAAHDGAWVFTTADFSLEPREPRLDPRTGIVYPGAAAVRAEHGGWLIEGEITDTGLYWLTDIFQELPSAIRSLASLFLKRPVILRLTGRFQGTARAPDGTTYPLSLTGHGEYMEIR
jgi:hypothetical protein